MSEPLIGAGRDISQSIIKALPPAFLLLLLINTVFLGLVVWFLTSQMESRMVIAMRIIEHCFNK